MILFFFIFTTCFGLFRALLILYFHFQYDTDIDESEYVNFHYLFYFVVFEKLHMEQNGLQSIGWFCQRL